MNTKILYQVEQDVAYFRLFISNLRNSDKKRTLNSFNTKGAKRITKDTKNFLCRFCDYREISAFNLSIRAVILSVIKFVVFHFAGSIVKQVTGKELKNNELMRFGVTRLLSTEVVLLEKIRWK